MSLWTATPHQNPPLDLTELEGVSSFQPVSVRLSSIFCFGKYANMPFLCYLFQADIEHPEVSYHRPQHEVRGYGGAYHSSHPSEEYVELQQKRESDI